MKRKVKRLRNIRSLREKLEDDGGLVPVVVGALGGVSNRLDAWLEKLGVTINTVLWCNAGITSAGAEAYIYITIIIIIIIVIIMITIIIMIIITYYAVLF